LKVDTQGRDLPVVPLGDSDGLDIGEWVIAIGNPMGLAHTVTAGIVSAKARREVRPDGRLRYADFIQTDASINPGNSGGPLFNTKGEVIGINTAINAKAQGIGFAIPINMVKTVMPALVRDGRVSRSWLGVEIQEVTPDLARSFGLKKAHGALITNVVSQGPADGSGIREGDIIVNFDGRDIDRHDDLPWLASTAGIGRTVNVDVIREGRPRTVRVKLGALPGSNAVPARADRTNTENRAQRRSTALGITVEPMTPRLRQRLGVEGGALVVAVDPGSVAARSGLRPKDVVVRANGQNIRRPADLVQVVEAVSPGKMVRLLVQREGGKAFIAFTR
ncbi:MAG: PDZ domain-containing protein, partial [Myxococcales bacterium]|nr:PDZ domain-containing protein [Myxococcales bacterium]